MRKNFTLAAAIALGLGLSGFAMAEDAAPAAEAAPVPNWTFPSSISLVSDYLFRGQTQTWGKPALQAGIEADHVSGFYAGFWGSNVSSHWVPNANLETDWSIGFRNTIAEDFKYDIGGVYVYYPDGDFGKTSAQTNAGTPYQKSKPNTVEFYGSLAYKWFSVKSGVTATKFFGWNYDNSGKGTPANHGQSFSDGSGVNPGGSTRGSWYFQGDVSYDIPGIEGLNVAGEIGRQTIADSSGLDWTWYKVGATKSFDGGWAVNLTYSGTTGSDAYKNFLSFDSFGADTKSIDKSKVVLGLTKSF